MDGPRACDSCNQPSITWLRYSGQRLCDRHLQEFVERRIKREVKRQGGLGAGRVLVAYSGGKDSTVALRVVHELAAERRDVEVIALTVDEGIDGYRPQGLEVASRTTRDLGIEHLVRRTKDHAGATMDDIQSSQGGLGACSYCGVFRRRIMNDVAKEIGASRLVTGHNLDDTAQAILMNLASADLDKLARLGPHATTKPGLVPRLMPLRTIPETEVYLYALTKGFSWHDEECPYAERAARGVYRDTLYKLEEQRPGTRHALLQTHERLRPFLETLDTSVPLGECQTCGEPASGAFCKSCEFRGHVARIVTPRNGARFTVAATRDIPLP